MTDKPTYNARISELELEVGTITEWATNIEKAFGQILKSNLELNARVQMLEEKLGESMTPMEALKLGIGALLFSIGLVVIVGLSGLNADAHPRDNCECSELRAIRRILEQQFNVVCNEIRCLPVPTPTGTPDGSELP